MVGREGPTQWNGGHNEGGEEVLGMLHSMGVRGQAGKGNNAAKACYGAR